MIGHRGINQRFSTGLLGSTAESVARKSPRPLFVSPCRFREIRQPVLAYDGSERASRAMRAAPSLPHLLACRSTVITVARDLSSAKKPSPRPAAYLEPYAIKTEFKLVPGPRATKASRLPQGI